ncbi:MAG: pyruvate, water dikinase, partial [bacterium]|nr:pyruvate, water dikinase [Candidatus Kapabacteria bacterium]
MKCVSLEHADDESLFGGKAIGLGASLRAGLNVPPGVALDVELVDAIANQSAAIDVDRIIEEIVRVTGSGRVAVRSSAVGEDSDDASFAGQHLTRLNVVGREALLTAINEVRASGCASSAIAYR